MQYELTRFPYFTQSSFTVTFNIRALPTSDGRRRATHVDSRHERWFLIDAGIVLPVSDFRVNLRGAL